MASKKKQKRSGTVVLAALLVVVMSGLGGAGWYWMSQLKVERVTVSGMQHAPPDTLVALAGVDTSQALLDLDMALVEDRVRRHPWVAGADARRLPTGTVAIRVHERRPVALVLDGRGRPSHYLDGRGYGLPLVEEVTYNVPLLRGLGESYHPVRPVENSTVLALLGTLADLDPSVEGLISDLEMRRDEVWLYTTPGAGRGAIPIRLGRDSFTAKLHRLEAFWEQAILTQPEKTIDQIDLRYASQIITK